MGKINNRLINADPQLSSTSENPIQNKAVKAAVDAKQDTLVSGTNIKTINSTSLLGQGNLDITGHDIDIVSTLPTTMEDDTIYLANTNASSEGGIVELPVPTQADAGKSFVIGSDGSVELGSVSITVDSQMSSTSENPVQNKVITVALGGKVDKETGKGLSTNDYTTAEKSKLAGIEAGAEVNAVDSVAGKTGVVTLAKGDVGLGNVDNTSDLNKPISTATQAALDAKVDAVLGKGLSTNDFTDAYKGDVDANTTARHTHPNKSVLDDIEAAYTTAEQTKLAGIAAGAQVNTVTSVAGKTGAVTLGKGDVGLGSVVNTGDSAIPVSGGTTKFTTGGAYTELGKKVDKETGKGLSSNDYTDDEKTKLAGIAAGAQVNTVTSVAGKTGAVTLAKGDVGLGNVDNKSTATIKSEFTGSVAEGNTGFVTGGAVKTYVDTAITNLPEPMVFKGTLGTGGTITSLPAAAASNEGFTYKVITAGTYASQSAKVGDVFVSNGSDWALIPAGDDVEDTWRRIRVNGTALLDSGISSGDVNFKSGSNVTITGSGHDITISSTDTDTGATSVAVSGSGNAVSDASYDASTRKITLSKGVTALTSHQSIKTLKTDNTTAQTTSSGEAIAGSGTINLHKVAKTGTYSDLIGTPSLATVATSGSYSDLSNKPTIPAAQVNSDWNASSGIAQILNKPAYATDADIDALFE